MGKRILITGGAGFVGSRLADELLRGRHRVRRAEHVAPEVTGTYRMGDIRHCFADITHARQMLGYELRTGFDAGLVEPAEWLGTQGLAV